MPPGAGEARKAAPAVFAHPPPGLRSRLRRERGSGWKRPGGSARSRAGRAGSSGVAVGGGAAEKGGRFVARDGREPRSPPVRAMPLLALLALLAGAPWADICEALNVTVSPGPKIQHLIGDNVTLCCHVSQKRRRENLLAVRWVFALPSAQEYLMLKMTKFGVVQYYGNYTSHFYRRRLHLLEKHRTMYTFLILNIQQAEQGHYICKVQEIGKQRNKWTSWSNGSASTEVQVFPSRFLDEEKHNTWAFFEDISVYVVLMCAAGILSILLFALFTLCQTLSNRRRSHVKCNLVKSPKKSLQEAGSPSKAAGPPEPPIQRKGSKATEGPPAVPAKAPTSHAFSKPKLLKPQRKVTLLKGREENLTYAELELLKPPQEVAGASATTVYAQILFQENRL